MASPFVQADADGNFIAPSGKPLTYSDIASLPDPTIGVPSEIADEPNGTVVSVGGSVSGVIDANGDIDQYSVNLIAGQTYLFSLRGTGATPINDSLLRLINPAFTAFVATDDDGGNNLYSMITYTALETGTFTIRAQTFTNANPDVGGYTIDVRVQGADAVGDTNATAVAIGLGTTFGFRESGSGGTPAAPALAGDVDRYSVDLVAGQFYTFNLAGGADYATPAAVPAGELDTFLILRDTTGAILAVGDDNAANDPSSSIGFLAETSGTYYIDATAFAGQTGGYALDFNQIDPGTLDPLDAIDWRSANDVPFVDVDGVPTAYVYFGAAGETFNQTADNGVDPMVTLGWQPHEIAAVMRALEYYEEILGTNYVITTDVNQATFRLSTTVSTQYGAYFFPQDPAFDEDQGVGVFNVASGGWRQLPQSLDEGGFSFSVILHEFGHAHGLSHPHDRGGGSDVMLGVAGQDSLGVFDLNQGVYTVMSYNEAWQTHPDGPSSFTIAGIDNGWSTFGAFDIAQLQARYGVTPANTGNNIYALTDVVDDAFYRTIWDSAGTDTISYAGLLDAQIDLNAATLDYSPTGGGVLSFLHNLPGLLNSAEVKGGYTIAGGVVIENATGGSGNDALIGNAVGNVLRGNLGDDFLMGGAGGDTLNGGAGFDTASYRTSASGVDVRTNGDSFGGDAAGDRLISIEGLEGSNFNDSLRGGNGSNTLSGLGGNDDLRGENGVDSLFGGDGNDRLRGGNGDDILDGGAGNDRFEGGNGSDIFVFGDSGIDTIDDYARGEKIDLSALGVTLADVTVSSRGILVALDGDDLTILFNTRGFSTADLIFDDAGTASFGASSFDALSIGGSSFEASSFKAMTHGDMFLM